jgi:hypothetical protein
MESNEISFRQGATIFDVLDMVLCFLAIKSGQDFADVWPVKKLNILLP